MAAQKGEPKINLLPQNEFETSTVGRILKWLLSTFRIMVIATEMIVMLAFLSRFWLDARKNDLDEEIKTKQAVLEATADFEKEFRILQKKLAIFASLANILPSKQILDRVTQYQPANIVLSTISLSGSDIQVKGVAPGEIDIGQYIANLSANKEYKSVILAKADTSENLSGAVEFILRIVLAGKGGQP